MHATRTVVGVIWLVFWVYWFASAFSAKRGSAGTQVRLPALGIVVAALLLLHVGGVNKTEIHSPVLRAVGVILLVAGLGLCVWARINLGRNWGMPMTKKDDPELVTSGPYRYVRHPIYSGLLLAIVGTAIATDLAWLVAAAIVGAYFFYSASVEEKLMSSSFPDAYAEYRSRTKMLIPFVL
jgi:protein-S-isoprenylcysteine O-methyltransferase Ste14